MSLFCYIPDTCELFGGFTGTIGDFLFEQFKVLMGVTCGLHGDSDCWGANGGYLVITGGINVDDMVTIQRMSCTIFKRSHWLLSKFQK